MTGPFKWIIEESDWILPAGVLCYETLDQNFYAFQKQHDIEQPPNVSMVFLSYKTVRFVFFPGCHSNAIWVFTPGLESYYFKWTEKIRFRFKIFIWNSLLLCRPQNFTWVCVWQYFHWGPPPRHRGNLEQAALRLRKYRMYFYMKFKDFWMFLFKPVIKWKINCPHQIVKFEKNDSQHWQQ
jgi:hypothetical protein